MNKLLLLFFLAAFPCLAQDTITSSVCFQDTEGNCFASGTLRLMLSQAAKVTSNGLVAPIQVNVALTSAGLIPANTHLYGNDQLAPGGTTYHMKLYNSADQLV